MVSYYHFFVSPTQLRPLMSQKNVIKLIQVGIYLIIGCQLVNTVHASNLPSTADIPEEVLRAEIIIEARSPIDGTALSANDFAELVVNTKQELDRDNAIAATSNPRFKETLQLIRLRSFLKSVGVPIK
jgi:hypothetical protein